MPSLLLTVDRGTFVAWLTADTTTPGITAPVGSLTRPLRLACPVCAERMQAETERRDPSARALDHIVCLPWNQDEIEHSIHPDECNGHEKLAAWPDRDIGEACCSPAASLDELCRYEFCAQQGGHGKSTSFCPYEMREPPRGRRSVSKLRVEPCYCVHQVRNMELSRLTCVNSAGTLTPLAQLLRHVFEGR